MAQTEIDLPSRGGLRGRIERLAHEYMLKASALKITVEILDEDDRRTALQAAPKKFQKAIAARNGHDDKWLTVTADDGVPLAQIPRRPKAQKKARISGKRLSLFVLEHLSEGKPSTAAQMLTALQLNGSDNNPKGMNGTMGSLVRAGWVKVNGDGYKLTAKGNSHQAKLRTLLEARGQITADAYVA